MPALLRTGGNVLKPYVALAVVAALLYGFLLFVLPVTLPFFLGLALAVLIDKPVTALERRRVPRPLVIVVILAGLLLALIFVITFGLGTLVAELAHLSGSLPAIWEGLAAAGAQLQTRLEGLFERLPTPAADYIAHQQEAVLEWLVASVGQVLNVVRSWAFQGIPNAAITLMIMGVATYLMSRDKAGFLTFLPGLVPAPWRDKAVAATSMFIGSAIGFVNAVAVLLVITALVTLIGLSLLRSPYAMLLAVLSGLLDLLPVLGPGLIFVPWLLYHLVLGDAVFGLGLAVVYAAISFIRTVLEPRIIGDRAGLHPLTALIALYVGLKLFGMAGFVIGPLSAILLKSLARAGVFAFGDEPPPKP